MIAAAMAATHAVEIQLTIRPDQERLAERVMDVSQDAADVRLIYYTTRRISICSRRALSCAPGS
jgi:hypothetical protein